MSKKRTLDEIYQEEEEDEKPNSQAVVARFDEYLEKLIEGQQDTTEPPRDAAAAAQIENVHSLNDEISALINQIEERLATLTPEESSEMIIASTNFINDVSNTLTLNDDRLTQEQRLEIYKRVMAVLNKEVLLAVVQNELQNESELVRNNIKGLFNALIEYFTEMASYGYARAPEILAKMGSVVAGTAIIGSAVMTPIPRPGNLLILLASFLKTSSATLSGLYFLKQGGVPTDQILGKAGKESLKCLQTGCKIAANKMNELFMSGLNVLGDYVVTSDYNNFELNYDSRSNASVASSASSASSAASAASAIKSILDVNEAQQMAYILEDQSQTQLNLQVDSDLTDNNYEEDNETEGSTFGGRRKSRRHVNLKRTKNRRRCRKCIKTKKYKSHYRKTLKRYNRKKHM